MWFLKIEFGEVLKRSWWIFKIKWFLSLLATFHFWLALFIFSPTYPLKKTNKDPDAPPLNFRRDLFIVGPLLIKPFKFFHKLFFEWVFLFSTFGRAQSIKIKVDFLKIKIFYQSHFLDQGDTFCRTPSKTPTHSHNHTHFPLKYSVTKYILKGYRVFLGGVVIYISFISVI